MPAGRPTVYKDEYVQQAEKLCRLGATDIELADFFDVSVNTIYRWRFTHPEFCEAARAGKEALDNRVERSLYNRAVGYTFDSVKIFMPSGAEKPIHAPFREHVPPDPGAAMNWLKNRKPDVWREKSEVDVTVKDMAATIAARRQKVAEDRGD